MTGPHHPFVCINRALCGMSLRSVVALQYVKILIVAITGPLHHLKPNAVGDCWHCRSGHTGNSSSGRFADRASLDYLGQFGLYNPPKLTVPDTNPNASTRLSKTILELKTNVTLADTNYEPPIEFLELT